MKTESKELQKFGFIFISYFIVFSFLFFRCDFSSMPAWIGYFSLMMVFISFFSPFLLKPVKFSCEFVLKIIHWLNMRVLLGFVFFFMFLPVAWIRRLKRKDFLFLNYDTTSHTYRVINRKQSNDIRRPY
ncbi:MAG: hypothetical protein ACD_44C00085G0002 [uncultured bacterium]|nr:MAG: hypothetical protein ACD_44C00085G0002 [uncultured bacterium]OGT16116.1 MAG: hypothetical protein A3B69_01675 [Gammaproteobacteria bacterium RIFCSPHIGHO2_02_FULL_38_33]OGT23561.1 MAG: hypothetical protein A2W47_03370 [Gammaproteobacteria bacterium RIFCSPHIGHO2_12_38_15]OGT68346.1 MAG: hypothetical protein A3I12_02680 [Gammaproteobacteria bacterium RIFCSPLOWO2_02_FULL_38_11]OGT78038.1 MAG: hypothetical protein A3G71_04710 [Gammaproteobacteria bacterium RIFCSPLOWO2_12_FULL_38_14]